MWRGVNFGVLFLWWKKFLCPKCRGLDVIKRGVRRGKIKLYCKSCDSWFQVNRRKGKNFKGIFTSHIQGESFRSIADTHGFSAPTALRAYYKISGSIPHCVDITREYCSKFCGILLVDGKYVSIKGYERKIPVTYGVDYLTHDIPHYILSRSESYQALKKFFTSLRLANYPLKAVVSDDNQNIKEACLSVYPRATFQLCQNHYKQNLRASLGLYQDETYLPFMKEAETLFCRKMGKDEFKMRASRIYERYKNDDLLNQIMLDIARRSGELLGYLNMPHVPRTNNLIESLNSHLEGRLKTIKGFESFKSADSWLNAYFIRRRLKPFTDCTKKFRHLNGKRSLEITIRKDKKIEELLSLIKWPFL